MVARDNSAEEGEEVEDAPLGRAAPYRRRIKGASPAPEAPLDAGEDLSAVEQPGGVSYVAEIERRARDGALTEQFTAPVFEVDDGLLQGAMDGLMGLALVHRGVWAKDPAAIAGLGLHGCRSWRHARKDGRLSHEALDRVLRKVSAGRLAR